MNNQNIKTEQPQQHPILENPFFNLLIDQFVIVLTILIVFYFTKFLQPKIKSIENIVLETSSNEKEIDNILIRICQLTNADRALLGKFHNGNSYQSGEHCNKFSATNEFAERGIKEVKNDIQNVDAKILKNEIINLRENDILFVHKENALKDCKKYLQSKNLEQTIEIAIRYPNKRDIEGVEYLVGIVSIQFLTETDENNTEQVRLSKDKIEKLKLYKFLIEEEIKKSREKQFVSIINILNIFKKYD